MLRSLSFTNWKSFKSASLNIDQITVIIGTNASGKSNAVDALEFLSRIASSTDISTALSGDASMQSVRGSLDWASYNRGKDFSLSVEIGSEDKRTDYQYEIHISIASGTAELEGEQLTRVRYQGKNPRRLRLFWTDPVQEGSPGIIARLYNSKSGTKRPLRRNMSIISQLEVDPDVRKEIKEGIELVARNLRDVFILDPKPSEARGFSRITEELRKDGANIAGVLMALPDEKRKEIEKIITELTAKIPERDIRRVWAEFVGRYNTDAMLYCTEEWALGKQFDVDARGMSDGTLRYIAVIGALLLRPKGSTIIIEEVDNGLHPSRALILLNAISSIARDRNIDLIITTHNVVLLDSLEPHLIRSVSVVTRDDVDGSSKIISLDEVPLLSRIIAEGEIGALSRRGDFEHKLKRISQDA